MVHHEVSQEEEIVWSDSWTRSLSVLVYRPSQRSSVVPPCEQLDGETVTLALDKSKESQLD
jgi:hypothetical protein